MPNSMVSQQHFSSNPERKYTVRDSAVAEAFHNAWCARKRSEGYYSPAENPQNSDGIRDPKKPIHLNLVPFSELPLGERDKRLWLASVFEQISKDADELEKILKKTKKGDK